MALPIGLGLAGLGLAGKIFGRGRRLSDDPEVKRAMAEYERLASDVGAEAEVEQQFRPARAGLSRQITALGAPGASGAVSGALAELEGQKAAVKAGMQRQAKQRLADIRLSLAGKRQPSFLGGLEDDLLGMGLGLAFPPKLDLAGLTDTVTAPTIRRLGSGFSSPSPVYGDEGVGTGFGIQLPQTRGDIVSSSRRRFEFSGNTTAPRLRRRFR